MVVIAEDNDGAALDFGDVGELAAKKLWAGDGRLWFDEVKDTIGCCESTYTLVESEMTFVI